MGTQDSYVSAIVASLDLQLVRLLRDAIRTTEAAGKLGGAVAASRVRIEPRKRIEPEPRFLPRPVIHPTPRFEPRPVVYVRRMVPPEPAPPPLVPECPKKSEPALPPPWKSLPSVEPSPPAPKVKVLIQRPDIVTKGSLIDFFI